MQKAQTLDRKDKKIINNKVNCNKRRVKLKTV